MRRRRKKPNPKQVGFADGLAGRNFNLTVSLWTTADCFHYLAGWRDGNAARLEQQITFIRDYIAECQRSTEELPDAAAAQPR